MIPLERFAEKKSYSFTLNLTSRFLRLHPDMGCIYAIHPKMYIMNDLFKLNISLNTCQRYVLPATEK